MAERTFVLGGPHETRITVVSQQVRAINLAVALSLTAPLKNARVAVVGAGAGGATFAAAASLLGASVDLFDEHEEPIATQRWSFDRYLHPNLFDWPNRGWDNESARLPIATWSAGPSAEVRLELLTGFVQAAEAGGVHWHPQHSVSEIRELTQGVEVTVCDLRSAADQPPAAMVSLFAERYDLVVVATGFLPEATIEHTDSSGSYWKDQGLPATIGARHVTIVGDGDGALTELLLLTVCRASGAVAHEMLRSIADEICRSEDQVEAILEVESSLAGARGRGSLEEYIGPTAFWMPDVKDAPRVEVRAGRVAMTRTSFAINRFVAARLAAEQHPRIRFVQGAHHEPPDARNLHPAHVIWRTGPRVRDRTVLARPALTVNAAGDAMARDPGFADLVGTVDELMDYTRERLFGSVPALERPFDGIAVEALEAIEADRARPAFDAPWPGFVERQASIGDLRGIVRRLSDLADQLDEPRPVRSNYRSDRVVDGPMLWRVLDLSLDIVAAAADLTPTEVVHRLRLEDKGSDIRLVSLKVKRTNTGHLVDRLWVRRRLRETSVSRPPLDPPVHPRRDYTLLSLLLAPAFTAADVLCHPNGETEFRRFDPPHALGDTALDALVASVGRNRERVARGERAESTLGLLRAIEAGDHDAEHVLMTDIWRALDSTNDLDVRRGLVRLAALIRLSGDTSPFVRKHLAELASTSADADLIALLLQAAFGHLTRLPASSPLLANDVHLRSFAEALLPGLAPPPPPTAADIARLHLARFGLGWELEPGS